LAVFSDTKTASKSPLAIYQTVSLGSSVNAASSPSYAGGAGPGLRASTKYEGKSARVRRGLGQWVWSDRVDHTLSQQLAVKLRHLHSVTMKAYSVDLRTKVVESVRRGISKSETARRFGISRSTVNRYLKRLDESGSLAPKQRPDKRPKLDQRAMRWDDSIS
jgi:transposase-like protein